MKRRGILILIAIIIGLITSGTVITFFILPKLSPPSEEPPYEPPYGYQKPQTASIDYIKIYLYNQSVWTDIFGYETNPIDLFGSNSDCVLYQSKYRNKAIMNNSIDVFDMVEWLYGVAFDVVDKIMIKQTYDEIGGEWDAWIIKRDFWGFSNNSFNDDPDLFDINFPILQNPRKISEIYEEIQALINYSYLIIENFSASEFIYEMVLKRFPFARPVDSYLEELILSLSPQNITLSNTTITFSKQSNKKYFVCAYYNNQSSNLYSLLFLNENNNTFYVQGIGEPPQKFAQIKSYDLAIFLSMLCIFSIGIVYIYYKGRLKE